MKLTLITLIGGLLLSPLCSLAQEISFVSPTKDSSVTPGQKLPIVLRVQGTTSSVQYVAFSAGFKTTSAKDDKSLGRPYVGSVFPSPQSTDVVLDSSKGTYTYQITVPAAKDFLDGFSSPYNLTVANYHLLGATYTPIIQLASVRVNVQSNNSPKPTNDGQSNPPSTPGGDGNKAPTNPPNGGGDGNKTPSPAESLRRPSYSVFFLLATGFVALAF